MEARLKRIAIAALLTSLLWGCGPSPEELWVAEAVDKNPKIAERGGRAGKVTLGESQEEKVCIFEAEIIDAAGKPIGKVRGRRIEGFGTRFRRFYWYDEVDPDSVGKLADWPEQERERRRKWREERRKRRNREAQEKKRQAE